MAAMEGPLSKWTNVMKGWQYRWFVLDENTGLLSYYTSKEKMMKGARRGCVRMKNAVIGIDDGEDSTFTITVDNKTFHFQARDGEEREKWIQALEETKSHHSSLRNRKLDGLTSNSIQDFEKKLTETDCYLQIFIEQVKNLESRMEKCKNDEEKEKYLKIHEQANGMLDYVKHAIVLLQIAKNSSKPAEKLSDSCTNLDEMSETLNKGAHAGDAVLVHGKEMNEISAQSKLDPNATNHMKSSEVLEQLMSLNQTLPVIDKEKVPKAVLDGSLINQLSSPPAILVPETSYSSSEDDDFYDAYEDTASTTNQTSKAQIPVEKEVEEVDKKKSTSNGRMNWYSDGVIDYDAMYDADDEDDLGSLEDHGSVISHLLSQVKLGMDLTKVVLPTFILECRSLLEMYADFFAHPDYFTSIVDFNDPKDRMVQVVKWYLSAFHAGRKSAVAKKPYNPILGEIFRCHWNIPSDKEKEQKQNSTKEVSDGPVPWAKTDQLTFIAEQVSHHPPMSAFYAEHHDKRISFCAHIWTKSKFLGLSIGVHNIGQGCVSLLDLDEEYIVTFPNAYGRSILTVPWIELGGSTHISCAKTGYNANIEFLTKPFYGGKKHRVTADVFQPNEKKPFLNINGEWNGTMTAKWATGKTETFIDTKSIPIIQKEIKPVSSQIDYESRRLWKEVTAYLRLKDVDKATGEKFKLEQKQRDEAKQRKENNTTWDTRMFHEIGENWVYDQPLQRRLRKSSS